MKQIAIILTVIFISSSLFAQKVKVKSDILYIDGKKTATIKGKRNKAMLGLVKDFTISNMEGKKLFTAVYSDRIPEDPRNNTIYFFEFDFLTLDKQAYFGISKLGVTKSLGNLIGKNGLIKNGKVDEKALNALIEKKGVTPPVVVTYEMAERPRNFPVELRKAGQLEQAGTVFCTYKDLGTIKGKDVYEFFAPDGTKAVRVSFSGGNNARTFLAETLRDKREHTANIASKEQIKVMIAVERNYATMKKIGKWLVENKYL